MDTVRAILTRRSVRQYRQPPVPDSVVEDLVRAAMQAPSACNQQPWEFVVITDRETLGRIALANENAAMCARAPVAILVCGNTADLKCGAYWQQDCSAATQNLLLAAHDAGLGGVWTGVYPDAAKVTAFQAILGLPDHVVPLAFVPLGYPAEQPEPENRYQPDRVHRERW
ncbi:MAG TPA: nitroreductase family protein [Armatimonadota bacterium]|jgi:nitroreductase